jgi:hypothetical protein
VTNDYLQAVYEAKLLLEKKFNIVNLNLQEKLVVDHFIEIVCVNRGLKIRTFIEEQDAASFLMEDNTNQSLQVYANAYT